MSASAHTPSSHPALMPKNMMTPTPTAIRTIPRRRSYHGRNPAAAETAAGVENNAGGIGWPFSTIIRTVLCKERLLAQLLNIMTATIATGNPNTVRMAMIAIGRTASGMSSSRWPDSTSALALSLSSMVRANFPCLNLRSTRCFILSANSFAGEAVAERDGEIEAEGDAVAMRAGEGAAVRAGDAVGVSGVGAGVCA